MEFTFVSFQFIFMILAKNHMKIHYCHHHHGFHRTCLFGSLAFLQVNCWIFPQVVCIGLYFYLASSEKVFQKQSGPLLHKLMHSDMSMHVWILCEIYLQRHILWEKHTIVAMFFVCATIGTFFRCFEKSTSWKPGVNIRNQDCYYPNNNLDDF